MSISYDDNRYTTVYKQDLALNNLQKLIYCKNTTNQPTKCVQIIYIKIAMIVYKRLLSWVT